MNFAATKRTKEEQLALWARAQGGDAPAKEELVLSVAPFVVKCANRFARRWGDEDDLMQEGFLGVLRAIELFDSGEGCSFFHYACYWIKAKMKRSCGRQAPHGLPINVKTPQDQSTLRRELTKAPVHLDRTSNHRLQAGRPEIPDRRASDPSALTESIAEQLLSELHPRDRELVLLRARGKTLAEVGFIFGVSRQRVQQLEARVKKKLEDCCE